MGVSDLVMPPDTNLEAETDDTIHPDHETAVVAANAAGSVCCFDEFV